MSTPVIAVHVAGAVAGDSLFDPASPANRDDCLRGFRELRRQVEDLGGAVHTHDVLIDDGRTPDIVLFLDVPQQPVAALVPQWPAARRWVVLQECEVVSPRNWDRAMHAQFERIFTWHPGWIDGDRYVRLDFANPLTQPLPGPEFEDRALATLVAGNKSSSHPLELYSARVDAIRWFEREAPDDFRFYGVGWDRRRFPGALRALNLVGALARATAPAWPSWGGPVDDKLATMSSYRFTICYENAQLIPGYVTEKLFDACSAGTIPVYWGAPDIAERIPPVCFIDRRDFDDNASLVAYLRAIDASEFAERRAAIAAFLRSQDARPYSAVEYGRVLAGEI